MSTEDEKEEYIRAVVEILQRESDVQTVIDVYTFAKYYVSQNESSD